MLFIIRIIIEFCLVFTIEVYTTFYNSYILVNIYRSKKDYIIIIKHLKKIWNKDYKKYKCNIIKIIYLKL